jgi:3D (Asp-Asp-Asp) domain-containing protein
MMRGVPSSGRRAWPQPVSVRIQAIPLPALSLHGSFLVIFAAALFLLSGLSPSRTALSTSEGHATAQRIAFALRSAVGRVLAGGTASGPPLILRVHADGQEQRLTVPMGSPDEVVTVGDALRAGGIPFSPRDRLSLNGTPVNAETPLPHPVPQSAERPGFAALVLARVPFMGGARPPAAAPAAIQVERALPVVVHDGPLALPFFVVDRDLAQLQAQLRLVPEDKVYASDTSSLSAGMHLYLQRSRPVSLTYAGATHRFRTLEKTVAAVLEERGIVLGPLDRVEPGIQTPIATDMAIRVVRVEHQVWTEEQVIPFQTREVLDPDLELDQRQIIQTGSEGLIKRTYRAIIEDGRQVAVQLERTETEREVRDTVIAIGTKVVLRELATPEGTVQYWRKFRVLATSYDAASAGKPPGSPGYGITALGLRVDRGVVAVDPNVIPLGSRLYVPGYGIAIAGDTGGAIKGRIIDLGFPEGEWRQWGTRWTDVYLLAPVPPRYPVVLPP